MGKIALVSEKFEGSNITANLIRISLNQGCCNSRYFLYYFLSTYFQTVLDNLSPKTTIQTITSPELKSILLPLPSLPEQHKIAEILSSVDTSIESGEERIQQLSSLKSALMQVLLTGKVRVKA
jgi:type I restriction enzyme S subunit